MTSISTTPFPIPPTASFLPNFNYNHFTHYTTIPAAFIILVLAFLERRRQKTACFDGRPALVVPIRLLEGFEDRLAYAAAFGAVTNDIVNLFLESRNNYPFEYPLWAVALILQLQALEVTLSCFPLFACIATRHRLIGSVCGLLYGCLLCCGVLTATIQQYCNVSDNLKTLQVGSMMRNIPIILCYMYLIQRFARSVVHVLINKMYTLQENTDIVRPHQAQHVRLLLKGYYDEVNLKEESFIEKLSYKSIIGFLYPVKIVAVVFIVIVLLYQLCVYEIIIGYYLQEYVEVTIQADGFDNRISVLNVTFVFLTPEAVKGMLAAYFISCAVSSILGIIHVYFFLKVYRKNTLRLYKGDRAFMMEDIPNSEHLMANSMRFPGYQIAYSLWGTVIMLVALLGLGLIVSYVLFLMWANGFLLSFLSSVAQLLSFPATTFLLFFVQLLLAKYFLLQPKLNPDDDNPPVNVDNRRFYEDFNFFTLFGSLAIGIVSCFIRIAIGTAVGIFMVGRLDKSTFVRNIETFDKGHMCYISMLQVDNAHNHPVLRVFCGILWDRTLLKREESMALLGKQNRRKYRTFPSVEAPSAESSFTFAQTPTQTKRQNSVFSEARSLRRWNLAYTLLKNTDLKKMRKHYIAEALENSEINQNSTEGGEELRSVLVLKNDDEETP